VDYRDDCDQREVESRRKGESGTYTMFTEKGTKMANLNFVSRREARRCRLTTPSSADQSILVTGSGSFPDEIIHVFCDTIPLFFNMDFSRRYDDDDPLISPPCPAYSRTASYTSHRGPSESTASTSYSTHMDIPGRKTASPHPTPLPLSSSPMSAGMGMRTASTNGTLNGYGNGSANGWDDADKLGYQFSLRVA